MSKLSRWGRKVERSVSNIIPHQHSADRRAANQAAAEQIDFYQKQKAEMEAETKRTDEERKTEKDRIAQKQIKSMQRAYRAPGFMEEESNSLGNTLG